MVKLNALDIFQNTLRKLLNAPQKPQNHIVLVMTLLEAIYYISFIDKEMVQKYLKDDR